MKVAVKAKDERIIISLLRCPTVKEAAADCEMSVKQIYNKLNQPEFREKYDNARREVLEQTTASLQSVLGDAMLKLWEIANDPENAPQLQINACEAFIRNLLKLTEQTDIIRRLDALERLGQ